MASIERALNRALREFSERTKRRPSHQERNVVEHCILRGFTVTTATDAALGLIETDF